MYGNQIENSDGNGLEKLEWIDQSDFNRFQFGFWCRIIELKIRMKI